MRFTASAIALALAFAAPAVAQPHVDRILVNGDIWTADTARPRAQALAIAGDRIVAVGSTAEIRALAAADTAVVDLKGRFVTPGFNDAHLHFPGPAIDYLSLVGVETLEAFQAKLAAYAAAHPEAAWIRGGGWGYSMFPGLVADRKYLDAVVSDRPVFLGERDGHMGIANSAALKLAGITAATQDPPNGHIVKDAKGEPTGELREAAVGLLTSHAPPQSQDDRYRALVAHMDEAAAVGLTAAQDAGTDEESLALFQRAAAAGALKLRFRLAPLMIPGVGLAPPEHVLKQPLTEADLARYVAQRDELRGALLKMGPIKGMLDGTVDAQTALMLAPFAGTTKSGIPFWEPDDLNRTVALYDRLGFQLMLHAIGDKAIREALDAFDYAARVNGTHGRRHRIEHVEVPDAADLPRFRKLGVIASTQPMFANPDDTALKNFAPLLGPARAAHADSFRIFDDAGIVQVFGSDWPVMNFSPIAGIAVAVTRMTPQGTPPGGWYPAGRIPVEAALRHYTIDGAYAAFDEDVRGSLTPGKLADIVVLSQDMLAIPPEKLKDTKVLLTIMGGRDTFRSPDM